MTKAQILDQIIAKKQEELTELTTSYSSIEKERASKYFEIIQEYFGGEFTLDDVYFHHDYDTSFVVKRPHKDYSYDKDMITIRIKDDWSSGEFLNIETSMYSTNDNSQWELERIYTAGEVAKVLLDHKDDIIAKFNFIKESFKDEYSEAQKAKWMCESQVSKLIEEKEQSYLDIASDLLNGEGLVFDKEKKGSIDLRWDWTLRGVTGAKIISKTASGKSVDIEMSQYGEEAKVYEKVRTSNVDSLLHQYKDYVIKA